MPVSLQVNCGDISARHFAILAKPNGHGDYGQQNGPIYALSEVRFGVPGLIAEGEYPATASTDQSKTAILTWLKGAFAASHDVYLGTVFADVNAATHSSYTYKGNQIRANASYNPGTLGLNTTYYWRIDEVNGANTWRGNVWSFTTGTYDGIEDFEEYANGGQLITNTCNAWVDGSLSGFALNQSLAGLSIAGNTYPYGYVHNGSQAMNMNYLDNEAPYFSEVTHTFCSAQNWTSDSTVALELSWRGDSNAVNMTGRNLYIELIDSSGHTAKLYYPSANFTAPVWTVWDIAYTSFKAVNSSLNFASIATIKLGEEGNTNHNIAPVGGYPSGNLWFDDIRRYAERCRPEMDPYSISGDCTTSYPEVANIATYWLVGDYTIPATAPSDANLVAKYLVGQSSGTTLTDATSHHYDGQLVGPPTWITDTTKTHGSNACLSFDGVQDVVNLPGGIFNDNITTQLTVTLWQYGTFVPDGVTQQGNDVFSSAYILDPDLLTTGGRMALICLIITRRRAIDGIL